MNTTVDTSAGAFLADWLENVKRPTIRAATYIAYRQQIRNALSPTIGGIPLRSLGPGHVSEMLAVMARAGSSPRMRQLAHGVLRCALADAAQLGLVSGNVCDLVDRPEAPRSKRDGITVEQAAILLAETRWSPHRALFALAVTTDLRQGELFGLQWLDVNIEAGAVTVANMLVENACRLSLEPLPERHRRTLTLGPVAAMAIRRHAKAHAKERQSGCPWVFTNTKGGPLTKANTLHNVLRPTLTRAGLPPFRWIDLKVSTVCDEWRDIESKLLA